VIKKLMDRSLKPALYGIQIIQATGQYQLSMTRKLLSSQKFFNHQDTQEKSV